MITVNYMGRMGNNMFQYSLARFLAEKKGYKLNPDYHTSWCGENARHTTGVDNLFSLFPNTRQEIDGIVKTDNLLHIGFGNNSLFHFDIEQLLQHDGAIYIDGWFQRQQFYFDNKSIISDYFYYDDKDLHKSDDQVVIHIRLTDFVTLGWQMNPQKIYEFCEERGFSSGLVITDEPDNNLLDCFKNDKKYRVERNSVLQDFHYLSSCKNLIISHSTFSWWAAFLSKSIENIYVPFDKDNLSEFAMQWNGVGEGDLIPDDPTYIKVFL
jgi:hypothetical protein